MAPEFEHRSPGIGRKGFAIFIPDDFAHHGLDFEDLSEITFGVKLFKEEPAWIEAVHVSHLHESLALLCKVKDFREVLKRFAGWFVEVDMFVRKNTSFSDGERVANIGFDQDGIDGRVVKHLIDREPF